jgi:hypothetical protein
MLKKLFGTLLVLSVIGVVAYYLLGCREEPVGEGTYGGE